MLFKNRLALHLNRDVCSEGVIIFLTILQFDAKFKVYLLLQQMLSSTQFNNNP